MRSNSHSILAIAMVIAIVVPAPGAAPRPARIMSGFWIRQVGLHRNSFVRASEIRPEQVFSMLWRFWRARRTGVSWANRSPQASWRCRGRPARGSGPAPYDVYVCVCMCVCVYVYMCICVCVCVCVCIYIYIYRYTHHIYVGMHFAKYG